MGLFRDLIGFSAGIASACARAKYGWKPVGSCDYNPYSVALSAFEQFGTKKCLALNLLSQEERRIYEKYVRDYPDGYESYLKKEEERRQAEEKRLEELYPDPAERFFVTELGGRHYSANRDEDEVLRMRLSEKREWDLMSASEKEIARYEMRVTGNYYGPEHVGEEYWL